MRYFTFSFLYYLHEMMCILCLWHILICISHISSTQQPQIWTQVCLILFPSFRSHRFVTVRFACSFIDFILFSLLLLPTQLVLTLGFSWTPFEFWFKLFSLLKPIFICQQRADALEGAPRRLLSEKHLPQGGFHFSPLSRVYSSEGRLFHFAYLEQ